MAGYQHDIQTCNRYAISDANATFMWAQNDLGVRWRRLVSFKRIRALNGLPRKVDNIL